MVAILMSCFGFQSVMYQLLKQTFCVNYFAELNLGSIGKSPVNKSDTIC